MDQHSIAVRILDKAYQVRCPADMVQELQNAAKYVDQEMRKMRDSGRIVGLDRLAVVTALNVAHELLYTEQKESKNIDEMFKRIKTMQAKIEEVLMSQGEMEL